MVLKPADAAQIGGRVEMTIGFADLVGFSHLGEQLTPKALVHLLNRHFTLQADSIQAQRGVVDKFIGDAIMAFWGHPFTPHESHAELACTAALAQIEAATRLRVELPEITGLRRDTPYLDVRVGLSTGDVVLGNLGSENTRSFTVIGDAVNLGSRLEGANRFYGTQILASQRTATLAGPSFLFREIDFLTVKGKSEPVRIFELAGKTADAAPERIQLFENFAAGLAAYREQRWDDADAAFLVCGGDAPARVFRDRIAALRLSPPSRDWNGIWKLDAK
jgi:class 3 adenylate cyclase